LRAIRQISYPEFNFEPSLGFSRECRGEPV
jgi:hypothetical protein